MARLFNVYVPKHHCVIFSKKDNTQILNAKYFYLAICKYYLHHHHHPGIHYIKQYFYIILLKRRTTYWMKSWSTLGDIVASCTFIQLCVKESKN